MIPQVWYSLCEPKALPEDGGEARRSGEAKNIKPLRMSPKSPEAARKRMSPEERRKQIVNAATKVIASKGFWGMSLQDIADEVGITEAALYHYISSKNDLLSMVIEQNYDSADADDFIYSSCAGTDVDGHRLWFFPRFCVNNVVYNLQRPELVRLFAILNGEALSPDHPAHAYFLGRHQKFWETINTMNWALPVGYDMDRFHQLWMLCMSAMDGLQYRWLADGSIDLLAQWFGFCNEIFAEPWQGLMDPSDADVQMQCMAGFGLHSAPSDKSEAQPAKEGTGKPHLP